MTQISIDASHEFPVLTERLNALEQRLNGDLTPLMRAIGAVLENSTRQRFADKKSPDGVSWANLMPNSTKHKTNKSHTKKGVTAKVGILVESGDLFKSITSHADKYEVSVGTPEIYGVYHQFGTANIPARPFLGINADDKQTVQEMINDYLEDIL